MFLAGMLLLFVGDTMAQQIPNAGVLQRDAEQGFKSLPPNKVHPQESEVAKPIAPKQGEVTLNVKAFKFSGNKLLSQEVLAKVLSPYLNHPLTFAQLRGAVDEIMNAYKDAGWLVRAYLPKQEIDAGVVQIEIIEGVFGGTQVVPSPLQVQAILVRAVAPPLTRALKTQAARTRVTQRLALQALRVRQVRRTRPRLQRPLMEQALPLRL